MAFNMTTDVSVNRVSTAVGAGITPITSLSVSTSNFNSCAFFVFIGTVTATGTGVAKVQGSDDDAAWSDLVGTGLAYDDTFGEKFLRLDIVRPTYRYLRVVITRATANSVIYGIHAHSYLPRRRPTASVVGLGGSELHLSPAAGTP